MRPLASNLPTDPWFVGWKRSPQSRKEFGCRPTKKEEIDEPTWRCHHNPLVGALGIQEPVILDCWIEEAVRYPPTNQGNRCRIYAQENETCPSKKSTSWCTLGELTVTVEETIFYLTVNASSWSLDRGVAQKKEATVMWSINLKKDRIWLTITRWLTLGFVK